MMWRKLKTWWTTRKAEDAPPDFQAQLAEQLASLRVLLAQSVRRQKKQEADLRALEREIDQWEERARQAVRANNDTLAKQALAQQHPLQQQRDKLLRLHREQLAIVRELQDTQATLLAQQNPPAPPNTA